MLINEEYIREFTEKNLWQLDKTNVQSLATSLDIEFKKSDTKDNLLNKVKAHENFDLINVYNMFKKWCFGLYPSEAQEIMGVNNETLKKLAKKGVIQVAYTRKKRMYGKYVDIPYYMLEDLLKLSKEELDDTIKEICKPASEKQLASIEKARATAKKNRTCSKCGKVETHKKYLDDKGWCRECRYEEEIEVENYLYEKRREEIEKYCRDFLESEKHVILDTETTGLESDDEIVEISIINMKGEVLLNTFVYTDKEISPGASAVNGITKEDIEGQPTIEALKEKLDEILTGKVIITYNADFDRRMLRQSGYKNKKMAFTCLMNMYTEYENEERWISLQDALFIERIKINQSHRALDDCIACLELIRTLAKKQ